MKTYKAILQYDGTGRKGWQRQEDSLTIQGDLDVAIAALLKADFTTRAASRTDIGVHAIGQVVKITTEDLSPLSADKLNTTLPAHIRCLELEPCPADFIPSMDQASKEYRYLFTNLNEDRPYIATHAATLNIAHMQTCVAMLAGTNDFKNFYSIDGKASTTLRNVLECDLTQINPQDFFQGTLFNANGITICWQFRIVGTGFLKHMVRHLVGALCLVGDGRLTVDAFAKYLHGELKQQRPWKKADPRGLYLLKVSY